MDLHGACSQVAGHQGLATTLQMKEHSTCSARLVKRTILLGSRLLDARRLPQQQGGLVKITALYTLLMDNNADSKSTRDDSLCPVGVSSRN